MYRVYTQRFNALSWRQRIGIALGLTLAAAFAVGLIILSFSLAIILLPIVAVALLIGRWRLNRALREAAARGESPSRDTANPRIRVIDADFEVVDDDRRR